MVDQILVYSDSLSWGIIPGTRNRLSFDKRWPGAFEIALQQKGLNIRVVENCLNGRRTMWNDPLKEGRDGSQGLAQVIEMHSPLCLIVLMLGINDFQNTHDNDARMSAQGMTKLITTIRQTPIEPGVSVPDILVVAPPPLIEAKANMADKFIGAEQRCLGLSDELRKVAHHYSCRFF